MSNSKTSLIVPVFSLERINTLSCSRIGNPTKGKPIQFILRKPAAVLSHVYHPVSEGLIIDAREGERYEIFGHSMGGKNEAPDCSCISELRFEKVTDKASTITEKYKNGHTQENEFLSSLSVTELHVLSSPVDHNVKIIHPIVRLSINVNVEVVFPAVAHSAYRIAYADHRSCGQAVFEVASCIVNPNNSDEIRVAFRSATHGLSTAQISDTQVTIAQMTKSEAIVLSDGSSVAFRIIGSYENEHPRTVLSGTNYESFGRMAFNITL
ncbi:MAG: hypothetical protein AABX38_00610 [Candidatus Micrarchaeota archaeon]